MRTIHHVVDVDARTSDVWTLLTTQDGLAKWWSTLVTVEDGGLIRFRFAGDFNPVMQVTDSIPESLVRWHCASGHDNWLDNDFDFQLVELPGVSCRLRFTQHYATELSDDAYGTYNFNWGYYLESLRLVATTGTGKPFSP